MHGCMNAWSEGYRHPMFGIWNLGFGISRTGQVLFGSGLSGLWEVTFLDIPLELFEYPGFRGLKRSHLSGFTVAFDYDI